MKNGVRLLVGMGLVALAGSCAGRNLPPEPDSYVAADAIGAERAADLATSPAATWLDDMSSAEMSTMAREALAGSPDLQIVEARYRAARWRARGAFGGSLLPNLSVGASGTRTEEPTATEERIRTEFMTSSVVANWEIDLWGRLTAQALAADLSADAARQDLNDARLSVAGQSARAWVDLIEAQQLLALAQEDLQTRERALDLTQRRYDAGLISSLNLRTARSQVASARGFQAQAQDSLLIASRRLQEIMGRYPDGSLRAEGELPTLGPLAAAGAPDHDVDDVVRARNGNVRQRQQHLLLALLTADDLIATQKHSFTQFTQAAEGQDTRLRSLTHARRPVIILIEHRNILHCLIEKDVRLGRRVIRH
jgi:outer membrane protein TolC